MMKYRSSFLYDTRPQTNSDVRTSVQRRLSGDVKENNLNCFRNYISRCFCWTLGARACTAVSKLDWLGKGASHSWPVDYFYSRGQNYCTWEPMLLANARTTRTFGQWEHK